MWSIYLYICLGRPARLAGNAEFSPILSYPPKIDQLRRGDPHALEMSAAAKQAGGIEQDMSAYMVHLLISSTSIHASLLAA